MQNLVCCLIFFLTFRELKGDSVNNEEQGNIASKPQSFWSEYNFGENVEDSVITDEDDSEDDEDFDDNRLGHSSLENIKLYKEILKTERQNVSSQMVLQRKARDRQFASIECLYCFGTNDRINISNSSENCYKGINISSLECGLETKQCYTELHPYFIKRGCYEPKKLNVTFYCKCTLCNDKPADKREFFVYDNIKDWSFDNRRLQLPNLPGVTAACKYCNTSSTGYLQTCLDGTNVEYTICDEGQVCFTHIDKYKGIIIRGCAKTPAYNSFFDFCNGSNCNNKNYWDSDTALQIYGNRKSLVSFTQTKSNIIDNMPLSPKKEDDIDDTNELNSLKDDAQSDLVSEFFEHVKEIFEQEKSDAANESYFNRKFTSAISKPLPSSTGLLRFIETTTKKNKIIALFENVTLTSSKKYYTFKVTGSDLVKTHKLLSTKPLSTTPTPVKKLSSQYQTKATRPRTLDEDDDLLDTDTSMGPINSKELEELDLMDQKTKKLSCILCDNVSNRDCNNPGNKLLPLIRCERNSDVCYTMQTPFGIVDRGCYSPLLNHTTYVCSCNLCNTIPMHDLPFTFTNKTEWLYNVQEMSHGRQLRRSVYSQMACVQCEVNQTIDEVPDINCLEGKYRFLPSQYCDSDEICGIRSIRNEGYIWRGCIKFPRYNYWWSFCSDDLCNFVAPTSLYDIQ